MKKSKSKDIARFTRAQRERQQLAAMKAEAAARLDRQADHQLHLGFHAVAERLAWRAAELREGGR